MSVSELLSDMHDVIFDAFGEEGATLAGATVTVVVTRDVEVMSGTETESYARVNIGSFPASVTPVRNQVLTLASGETFKIGDEIGRDVNQKRFILK